MIMTQYRKELVCVCVLGGGGGQIKYWNTGRQVIYNNPNHIILHQIQIQSVVPMYTLLYSP